MQTNYIFVTGGIISSLGKGVTVASLASLLETRKINITTMKLNPCINVNSGSISPIQDGEIFVTEDGTETDLDLGHYERFIKTKMSYHNYLTIGCIYSNILKKEKNGNYINETIRNIPHITDRIQQYIFECGKNKDIILVEIGGTIEGIESLLFLESIRQMTKKIGKHRTLYIHLTLVPYLAVSKEMKTKPTQHSIKTLLSYGIQPDILICRSNQILSQTIKSKIASFCNLKVEEIISLQDVDSIYQIPLLLHSQGLDNYICTKFSLYRPIAEMSKWEKIVYQKNNTKSTITIGIVGKYIELPDAYISIIEALNHAGFKNHLKINIELIDSKNIEMDGVNVLHNLDAILIPGGFGYHGVEGKILAVQYIREKNIPYLGICLGMQIALIEFARNVVGMQDANSFEFFPKCKYPVISLIPELDNKHHKQCYTNMNMRLGNQICYIENNSLSYQLYKQHIIIERHRHQYGVNQIFLKDIEIAGLRVTGWSQNKKLVEIIEYPEHPWFIASQFHPEFISTPYDSHPLFIGFTQAAYNYHIKKKINN